MNVNNFRMNQIAFYLLFFVWGYCSAQLNSSKETNLTNANLTSNGNNRYDEYRLEIVKTFEGYEELLFFEEKLLLNKIIDFFIACRGKDYQAIYNCSHPELKKKYSYEDFENSLYKLEDWKMAEIKVLDFQVIPTGLDINQASVTICFNFRGKLAYRTMLWEQNYDGQIYFLNLPINISSNTEFSVMPLCY